MASPIKKHGGARPGAGRPPGEPATLSAMPATSDPLEFLLLVMGNPANDARLRMGAAVALLPYVHAKKAEGVKEQKQDAARKAGGGKFAPSRAPVRLVT